MIIRDAFAIINQKAGDLFAKECGIKNYPVQFAGSLVQVFTNTLSEAKELYFNKYTILSIRCWEWNQEGVEIYWHDKFGQLKSFFISAKPAFNLNQFFQQSNFQTNCHKKLFKGVLDMINSTFSNLDSLPTCFHENPFLWGLVSDEWLRIAHSVLESEKPCFLVSMDFHRNILFNQAAVDLLHSTPQKLLQKSLPKLWVPHPQPIDYSQKLPSPLTDFNQALRTSSSSRLENIKFQNWKENAQENTAEWVEWCDDVEYVSLPNGGHARKMMVLDWKPVPRKVEFS